MSSMSSVVFNLQNNAYLLCLQQVMKAFLKTFCKYMNDCKTIMEWFDD